MTDGDEEMDRGEFADRVRQLRDERGWTQVRLAEEVGVTDRTIKRWENQGDAPTEKPRLKIARLLGVHPEHLPRVHEESAFGGRVKELHRRMEQAEDVLAALVAGQLPLEAAVESQRSALEELRLGIEARLDELDERVRRLGG